MTVPACHPDRPHYAHGKCVQCWRLDYRRADSKCHPGRSQVHSDGLCQTCWLRQKTYGVTPAQYDEMFAAQGGVCAICGEAEARALGVDHNHATGQNRALLCTRCNTGLGLFRERPDLLAAASKYLAAWSLARA